MVIPAAPRLVAVSARKRVPTPIGLGESLSTLSGRGS